MTYEAWSADAAASVLQEFTSDSTKVLVALQELQQRFGFVHDEDLEVVARTCNVSRAEVYGVLTFYHELRTSPPAARVVRVCREIGRAHV